MAQSFAVDPQPIQVVEGSAPDGVPLFGLVAGATRLTDGTIVIGDRSSSTLKFFDGQARLTRTAGRDGDGPGEFRMLNGVKQCARDSLFATDAGHGVSVFSASGAFVRQFRLPQYGGLVACSPAGVLAVVNEGEEEQQPREGGEVRRLRAPLLLADARGTVTHELGIVSLHDIHCALPPERTWRSSPTNSWPRCRRRCGHTSGAVSADSRDGAPAALQQHPDGSG